MKISAKILADSVSDSGKRITSFEIELPKVILAEMNTHSLLARNFSSSRAIPVAKAAEIDSFEPLYWGKNQAGMVSKEEEIQHVFHARDIWNRTIEYCKDSSKQLGHMGLHKQWANRLNDWHVMAKGVVTATEWDNFLWLRTAEDTQPELRELALQIESCLKTNMPTRLHEGEWHLPYVNFDLMDRSYWVDNPDNFRVTYLDLEDAKIISMASCAAVSYRTEDVRLDKAKDICTKLFSGAKVHASPAMHQATPMLEADAGTDVVKYMLDTSGITHIDRHRRLWSGNFIGWIQQRQLLENHCKWGDN